jgi:transcriptional regulator with XRE-family HTH domain
MAQKDKEARARFAANVERLREQRGFSSDRLGELSELGRGELEAILRGEADADFDSIQRLAGALDVTPGELYEGVVWVPDGEGGGEYRVKEPPGD